MRLAERSLLLPHWSCEVADTDQDPDHDQRGAGQVAQAGTFDHFGGLEVHEASDLVVVCECYRAASQQQSMSPMRKRASESSVEPCDAARHLLAESAKHPILPVEHCAARDGWHWAVVAIEQSPVAYQQPKVRILGHPHIARSQPPVGSVHFLQFSCRIRPCRMSMNSRTAIRYSERSSGTLSHWNG